LGPSFIDYTRVERRPQVARVVKKFNFWLNLYPKSRAQGGWQDMWKNFWTFQIFFIRIHDRSTPSRGRRTLRAAEEVIFLAVSVVSYPESRGGGQQCIFYRACPKKFGFVWNRMSKIFGVNLRKSVPQEPNPRSTKSLNFGIPPDLWATSRTLEIFRQLGVWKDLIKFFLEFLEFLYSARALGKLMNFRNFPSTWSHEG
jgi:hypothetical protein